MLRLLSRLSLLGNSMNPEYGHVMQDVLMLAAAGFHSCIFSHVKHIDNIVAHFLARKAVSGNELQVWIGSSPADIALLVTLFIIFSCCNNTDPRVRLLKKKKKKLLH